VQDDLQAAVDHIAAKGYDLVEASVNGPAGIIVSLA